MYLVYRFRSEISKRLLSRLRGHSQADIDLESMGETGGGGNPSLDKDPGMTLDEKMRFMRDRERVGDCNGDPEMDASLMRLEDFDESEISEWSKYREILANALAYQWLQSALRTSGSLQVSVVDKEVQYHYRRIGDMIIREAGKPEIFSRKQIQELCILFTVDWDPFLFAQEQQYDVTLSRVLTHAITLTGHSNNLQAARCEGYLKQTWPETGTQLLSLIQRCAENGANGCDALLVLGDKTRLAARLRNQKLELEVVGNVFSVAEIAEQISWIGAALRSSPADEEAAYSTPHIAKLNMDSNAHPSRDGVTTTRGLCNIEFEMEMLRDADLATVGKCWRGMFGNPVIVRGYPIPRRIEPDTGLEVPLDMIAALTGCQQAVNFNSITYLKGFAAMLAAVRIAGDVVFWHLCYNPDGEYISYVDSRVSRSGDHRTLDIAALEGNRHIVGWSDNVRNFVGAPDADYGIEWSGLPSPNSTHVLEKVTLSGSAIPFITPDASFIVGVKDRPLHLGFGKGDDYMGNLITIGKRRFVFYDNEERRAWLVDGVSAVLHLLRAYIKFYAEDDRVSEYFMYSEGDIEEARQNVAYTGAKAAYEVLMNIKNQNLPLYPKSSVVSEERTTNNVTTVKTDSKFTLRERVEQICHVLLQSTAYHDDMGTQSGFGWRIKSSPRHQIEGFEFMDVATRHDTLWPKVATIQAMSVGWVHLVRSLRAVPLFGVGFGELFRPVRKEGQIKQCCRPTASVPIGKDFLAVYGADLQDMLRTGGSKRRSPWRLAGNIHWHSPDGIAFESCKCQSPVILKHDHLDIQQKDDGVGPKPKHTAKPRGLKGLRGMFGKDDKPHHPGEQSLTDTVQVLLPATFSQLYGRGLRSPPRIVSNGAVIFGHSWKFPLRWCLTKDVPPVEGEPDPPPTEEVSSMMSDSGIGTAIDSSDLGPTPWSSSSFYSQGSNGRFSYRESSRSPLSTTPRSSGSSSTGQRDVDQLLLSPFLNTTGSKKRPSDALEDEQASASKVRRAETG